MCVFVSRDGVLYHQQHDIYVQVMRPSHDDRNHRHCKHTHNLLLTWRELLRNGRLRRVSMNERIRYPGALRVFLAAEIYHALFFASKVSWEISCALLQLGSGIPWLTYDTETLTYEFEHL